MKKNYTSPAADIINVSSEKFIALSLPTTDEIITTDEQAGSNERDDIFGSNPWKDE